MSIKLTDTQLVLLSAAAQRKDLCLVAPATLKGATAQKVASKLISLGFIKEVKAKANDPIWRRDEGASYALKLTATGAKAIAVDAAKPEDADEASAALANRDQAAILSKLDAKDARPAEAIEPGPAGPSAPRGGSKLARVIALLERDHGATIAELIAATGWLAHTTRAALTGLRKRGYAVAIDRSDDNRGSFYRIPAGETGLVEGPANSETARRKEQGRSEPQAHQAVDGRAPTTARRGRRSASPAAARGRPGPRRHDRGAGRARRERTLPAMAQPLGRDPSAHLPRWLLMKILAYRIQATAFGGFDKETLRVLRQPKGRRLGSSDLHPFEARIATTREGTKLKAGALLAREWNGRIERVMILDNGFAWNGETYGSLSQVAKAMTGTSWNGHRFFGLRTAGSDRSRMIPRRSGIATPLRPAPLNADQRRRSRVRRRPSRQAASP